MLPGCHLVDGILVRCHIHDRMVIPQHGHIVVDSRWVKPEVFNRITQGVVNTVSKKSKAEAAIDKRVEWPESKTSCIGTKSYHMKRSPKWYSLIVAPERMELDRALGKV